MGCGYSILKWILGIINFIFWLAGVALLAFALYLHFVEDGVAQIFKDSDLKDAANTELFQPALYLFMALGSFILLIGFFGCCGACCEKKFLLVLYCIFVVLCLIIQITAIVLMFYFWNQFLTEEQMENFLMTSLNEQGRNGSASWNYIQFEWQCCGSSGYRDYKNNTEFDSTWPVTQTCCVAEKQDVEYEEFKPLDLSQCVADVNADNNNSAYVNRKGCAKQLLEWINAYQFIIGGIGIGVCVVELILLIMAGCMITRLRKEGGTTL